MRRSQWSLLCLLVAVCGCRDGTAPNDPPLSGKWTMLCGVDVACEFELAQSGSSVSGKIGGVVNGRESFYGNVAGSYDAPAVHLEWTVNRVSNTLDGVVQGDSEIVGTWHDGPAPVIRADFFKSR